MTAETGRITADQERPPLWRNGTFLKWAAQLTVLATLLVAGWIVIGQALANLEAQGLTFDWEFLSRPVGFGIAEGFETQPSSALEALLVGAVNTLRVVSVGLVLALVVGVVIGVARLSSNWLVSRSAQLYVEIIRNIPLLLQIIFWNVVFTAFPPLDPETAGPIEGWLLMSSKGISMAGIFGTETVWQWLVFAIVGLVAARMVYTRRFARFEETGQETHPVLWALGAFVVIATIGWFAHPIAGGIGWVFGAVASVVALVPAFGWSLVLAGLVLLAATLWIRRFLASFRTPAGMAKLTDDDWFRVVFAGVIGVAVAAFLVLTPQVVAAAQGVVVGLFEWLDGRFEFLRSGAPLRFGQPAIVGDRFPQYADTGLTFTVAFTSVLVGLVVYTGAFIAEIVRAGILSVPKGQTEAAQAVGLNRAQILRLVVLPQAFRVILPPLGNQFLNLTKNSSLAIAVGYADIVQVGQTVFNQTGKTIQVILIWMAFYLTLSLSISAVVNKVNRRLKLVER
ncbi:MAG: ABC transporter permease subunit [Acidimicrobiia bacterium]